MKKFCFEIMQINIMYYGNNTLNLKVQTIKFWNDLIINVKFINFILTNEIETDIKQ